MASMTTQAESNSTISQDDPRYGYAVVTSALHPILAEAANHLDRPTPCSEFNVKDLLNHVVMVQQRSAAIGSGRHWSEVQDQGLEAGWSESFQLASHDVQSAWSDDARLGAMVEVPWGELPGAAVSPPTPPNWPSTAGTWRPLPTRASPLPMSTSWGLIKLCSSSPPRGVMLRRSRATR